MKSYLDQVFEQVDRSDFLPVSQVSHAEEDRPLLIGYSQTNSQPSTVRAMLSWLDPQPGDRVLDVGSGSGWTSGLLSVLVTDAGHIYATEIIPELLEFGRKNCAKYQLANVSFHAPGPYGGLRSYSPFDRILVSAGTSGGVPDELLDQLATGGTMVIPVDEDILEVKRKGGNTEIKEHRGYAFVSLIDDEP